MIKLSIVVPVYNVQDYVEKCLKSLQNLKIENEIIIVNDGSKDESLKIIEEFKKNNKNENIKIITQENKGLSGARNTGLREAKGKYVSFIDSDDFVEKKEYENLIEQTIMMKLDIGIGNIKYYYKENSFKNIEIVRERKLEKENKQDGKNWLKLLVENKSYRPEVYDSIYNKEFLLKNNLFFKEGRLHEDEIFKLEVMLKAKSVKYFNEVFYNYVQRENSIMTSKKIKNYYDILESILEILKYAENEDEKSLVKKIFFEKSFELYKFVLLETYNNYRVENKKILKKYNKQMIKILKEKIRIRYKIEFLFILFNFSVYKKILEICSR